ncbi:T-complex protein 10A homolog 1 isoform X2 [Piliocolobus tephrosceles]|uniref:T-complex protein 10A homolog 1 isoform X2 n=1 Tax=Piliocolobus tephrosceles TaxID=591936 RepID=UPI000C299F31|nr:T-complex protein 10A homolog 1 isoform X2 [Piliocolobus tephrosceles]
MLAGQLKAGTHQGTHPEDPCPGAGAVMEKTAAAVEVPTEDCNTGETQPLQQQIIRLHQELGRQKSLWADVHGKLRSHIDALRKQNVELREKLISLQLQRWEARQKSAASPHAGQESRALALEPAFGKISPPSADEEKMPKYVGHKNQSAALPGQRSSSNNSAPPKPMSLNIRIINLWKTTPQENRDKSLSGRCQGRRATPTGRPTPCAERRRVSEDGKVASDTCVTLHWLNGKFRFKESST